MAQFSITPNVTIEPQEAKDAIEATCIKLFGQDKGDDETPSEFLNRRTAEWILGWYRADESNLAAHQAGEAKKTEINTDAQLPKRKDKAKE